MSEPTHPRPRQVTMAGWLLMVGSAFVLLLVFDRLAGLHTLETRRAVESFVRTPPGSDLGVGVEGVLTTIRTLAMVTAGCATAAGILGYQVLRRSRSARIGVTVLAVPLFIAGLVTGGFVTSIVAAAAVILWLQPARSWFRGEAPPQRPERPAAPAARAADPFAAPSTPPAPPAEASPSAPSSQADGPHPPPPPAATPFASSSYAATPYAPAPYTAVPERRPRSVTWSCVLTWVFASLTIVGLVVSGIVLGIDPDLALDQVHRENPELASQGVTDQVLIATTYALLAAMVLWCASTIVLAVLTFRRIGWARIVLVISASTACLLCLLGSAMGAVLLLLPLIASAVTVGLLLRPDSRAWIDRR